MWTWIGIGAGVMVLLLAMPVVIGMFLPKEFTGKAERVIAASPEAVWAVMSDPQRQPLSTSMCRKVEMLDVAGGLPAWREDIGSSRVRWRMIEATPPNRRVLEAADEVVPMTMRVVNELIPEGAGTRVRVHCEGAVESGTWHVPIFRFMLRVFDGASRGQQQYLDSIEKAVAANSR